MTMKVLSLLCLSFASVSVFARQADFTGNWVVQTKLNEKVMIDNMVEGERKQAGTVSSSREAQIRLQASTGVKTLTGKRFKVRLMKGGAYVEETPKGDRKGTWSYKDGKMYLNTDKGKLVAIVTKAGREFVVDLESTAVNGKSEMAKQLFKGTKAKMVFTRA
jgi:hypothetical protein